MRTTIEVADTEEAALIRAGLEDAEVRAFVKIIGALKGKTKREQKRILTFVYDQVTDPDAWEEGLMP